MFPVLSKAPKPLFATVSDKLPGTSEQVVETWRGFFPSLWQGLGGECEAGAKLDAHKPSPQPSPKRRGRKTSNSIAYRTQP